MTEFIEMARNIDILVVFTLIYIAAFSALGYTIAVVLTWWTKKWDSFWNKHTSAGEDNKQ